MTWKQHSLTRNIIEPTSLCLLLFALVRGMPAQETPPGGSNAPQRPEQAVEATGHWELVETVNAMTDRVTRQPQISVHGIDEGEFRLSASCKVDPRLKAALNVDSKYVDLEIRSLTNGVRFQSADAQTRCTEMEVYVGDGMIRRAASSSCASDKVAVLDILGNDVEPLVNDATSGYYSLFKKVIGGLTSQQDSKFLNPEAALLHTRDVTKADSVRIRFALTDGEKTVLRIPVDSTLRDYVSACVPPAPVRTAPPAATPSPAPNGFHSIGAPETDVPLPASQGVADAGEANLDARSYKGSADGFAASLPKFVQQAIANGVIAQDYSPEIKFIAETARACGRITRDMVARGTDAYGFTVASRFQTQYVSCFGGDWNVSANARRGDLESEEHLGGDLKMKIEPHGKWGHGTGFTMTIHWTKRHAPAEDVKVVNAEIASPLAMAGAAVDDHTGAGSDSRPEQDTSPTRQFSFFGGNSLPRWGYPAISSQSISPASITLGAAVTISYIVSDMGGSGLLGGELWRASADAHGHPGAWSRVKAQNLAGAGPARVIFADTPPAAGKYWYGLHLYNRAGRQIHEPAPLQVTVAPDH